MYHDADSSWGHRKNILRADLTTVGIGYARHPDGLLHLAFYLVGSDYSSDPTLVTAPPLLDAPTVIGKRQVTVTGVKPRSDARAADVVSVVFYAGHAVEPARDGDTWNMKPRYRTVSGRNDPPGSQTWTADLENADARTLHAVAVDRSGNYTDRAAASGGSGTVHADSPAASTNSAPVVRVGTGFESADWGATSGTATGLTTTHDHEGGAWWRTPDGRHGWDFSDKIVGNSGARVYSIMLARYEDPSPYSYCVIVDGQGPRGAFSGSLTLHFTDETGDRYALGLWDSTRKQHRVSFNSAEPSIVTIDWGS